MFAGVVRVKVANGRIETRYETVVEECGFYCHLEKVLNAIATVLRTACERSIGTRPGASQKDNTSARSRSPTILKSI